MNNRIAKRIMRTAEVATQGKAKQQTKSVARRMKKDYQSGKFTDLPSRSDNLAWKYAAKP